MFEYGLFGCGTNLIINNMRQISSKEEFEQALKSGETEIYISEKSLLIAVYLVNKIRH